MADGGVRNRAKLFEQNTTDSTAPSPVRKPAVANKPKVLAKPDATPLGKESEETRPSPLKKFGITNPAPDGSSPVTAAKLRGGLNNALTPKGLRNDNSPDSNNNKSATVEERDSKEDETPKKALLPPKSSKNILNASGGEKPATLPKFPTPGSKRIISEKQKPQIPAKVPLLPKSEVAKNDVNKTESICSTSSNSSDSSNSSTSPNANNVTKDKGQFDFSKNLRPMVPNGLPPKRSFLGSENTPVSPTSDSSTPSPPPLPKSALPHPTSPSKSKFQPKAEHVSGSVCKPEVNLVDQLSRLKARNKSIEKEEEEEKAEEEETLIVLRESDGKKFRKITLGNGAYPATAPEKPTLPTDIDLSMLRKEYENAVKQGKETCSVTPSTSQEEEKPKDEEIEEDEFYADAESLPAMRLKKVEPEPARKSERISEIPIMTAEEEEGLMSDEIYTLAETEAPAKNEEPLETEQERKRRKKEEEKVRKEKERQEKEQEKQRKKKEEEKERQRKKQEEEEMKRRKAFKLTGNEHPVGEGEIKDDAKGSNLNLKVRSGQKVTIVRIDNNPANKWLVKTDTQMGYVDSTNISVDPDIIKQAMTRDRKEPIAEEDFDQPTYDAVPEDTSGGGSTPAIEELEYEDVYEQF